MVRPMLQMARLGYRVTTCNFSSASRSMKKSRTVGMAPKVRKATRTGVSSSLSNLQNTTHHDGNSIVTPLASFEPKVKVAFIAILQSAFVNKIITIDGERQFEFLCQYQEHEKKNSKLTEKLILCKEYQLTPLNLYHLSKILGNVINQEPLARRIMVDAAGLGEPLAASELVEAAIRTNSFGHPDFPGHLQMLKTMADGTNSSGQRAMATLGNYFMSQQKYKEAMRLLTDATDWATDLQYFAQAFLNMGKIHLIWKDKDAAHIAFMKSARASNRESLYYLAAAAEDGTDNQKEAYEVAALGGIHEASHNLGDVELEMIESRPEKPKTMIDYGMAREWFQVAATSNFVPSMLNMALICKSVGEKESGIAWLENAEKWLEKKPSPELQDRAKQIRKNWSSQEVGITAVDSGYCGKIDPFNEVRET